MTEKKTRIFPRMPEHKDLQVCSIGIVIPFPFSRRKKGSVISVKSKRSTLLKWLIIKNLIHIINIHKNFKTNVMLSHHFAPFLSAPLILPFSLPLFFHFFYLLIFLFSLNDRPFPKKGTELVKLCSGQPSYFSRRNDM